MTHRPLVCLFLLLCCWFAACSERDTGISVPSDDPAMDAAIAKARDTLPQFWQAFQARSRGDDGFALKVRIDDEFGTEYFWVINIERRDGTITGEINNDPGVVRSVKLGERIEVPERDISDWLFMRRGKMVGNETLRPLLKLMPEAEAERLKSMLAEP